MNVKSRKTEQSEATRAALLAAGEQLFAERGYAGTATEDVVARASVTRGALYHHFKDKQDLFRAVFIVVEERLTGQLAEVALAASDPWKTLTSGADAFLDLCMDPTVQRIVLIDAPSVLGWQQWRELEAQYGLGLLKEALRDAMDSGVLAAQPVDTLAHLLLAALNEAALFIAQAANRERARADVGTTIVGLLTALRADRAAG